ncbi:MULTISPECIES: hypothetical protein [Okeania]|uniref:Uncharacterized protein n=1 Tax=Okeania hirsuta TaxID=1458930 RepID=A0A3N6RJK1_9CYAN|nr:MULTISPECIES: hypothetical protein [Okeania]NET12243.1 hypothetical protein [Okeania sp. SIO1H6]NES78382.1 hypothetical protein [Okeania sp. SIO1H4]NET21038.1 hypothetical protein [Okeania sp. SIO1H5]NET77851.1 hypothetical protein [Okeania sp. SIO1F9]NET95069.1 hypothetical protein [Okeania sp. SIO1H2]
MLRIVRGIKRQMQDMSFDKAVVSAASRRVGWRTSERVCTLRVSSPYPIDQESGATPRRRQSHLVAHQEKRIISDLKNGIEAINSDSVLLTSPPGRGRGEGLVDSSEIS